MSIPLSSQRKKQMLKLSFLLVSIIEYAMKNDYIVMT